MSRPPTPLEKVILVDDSAIDNKLHKRVIERTGLVGDVLTFPMAEDALDYLRTDNDRPPDLILLDINMPRMDGFEMLDVATEELGGRFAESVVVMLSTSMDAADQQKARGYEVIRDYFVKPLTRERFEELVATLVPSVELAVEHSSR